MRLHLKELYGKDRSVRLDRQVDVSAWIRGNPDIRPAGLFQAEAVATGLPDNRVRVDGSMDGRLELVCSRCLTAFAYKHAFGFTEMFADGDPDAAEAAEEDDVHCVKADRVELDPYFEEHFWLELPPFPLCDEHCRGLCSSCGANRNTEDCACKTDDTDPRWSGLKDLLP